MGKINAVPSSNTTIHEGELAEYGLEWAHASLHDDNTGSEYEKI